MLPDGWKSGKIKDFFMLQRGFDLTKAQACSGNVPVISSSGVSYYHDTYKVIGPGIVTGRKGNIGDVHIINENFWPHDTALWVSDFKSNNINYIKYFLDYVNLKKFDEASSVPTLNRNNVLCLNCCFPPLPEQKKIAAILSTWDRAIERTEKLLANSQQQKKALMQQLLTGKKRLPGFTGKWEKTNIGNIAKEISIRNKNRKDYPVISCTKTKGFVDSLSFFNKKVYSDDLSGYKIISRNQIGFPSNHVEEGSIGLQNLHDDAIVSPIYTIFSMKENADPLFVFAVLKTDHYRQIFAAATNSSVDRRGSLRWSAFSQIKINLPSLSEQKAIAAVLTTADEEIMVLESDLSRLRQEKKALMQQLLTGKRRVMVD